MSETVEKGSARSVGRLRDTFARLRANKPLLLSALALAIGLMGGFAALVFRLAIDAVQRLSFGFGGEQVATLAAELPWWQLLLAPTAGGLVIGLFVYRFMPGRRPEGVPEVIEATALKGGRMGLGTGLKAAVVSAASIGVGASVGREGPVVHLGASLGGWLAGRLRLNRGQSRTLLGCGVAAAVAASFNAPIAGTFFALEVVVGHYSLSAFAPIVIAAVTGTMVTRARFGDFPAFILPENWVIASLWEFPSFALLGVVSALAAIIFMRSIVFTQDVIARVPLPTWGHPALAGLAVGLIALAFPQVLGVGYEATDAALSDLYPLWLLAALIAVKTAATAISLAGRFGGGVFSPSLFIGAMVGGAYGIIATHAFPHLSSGHGAYTLIGMGAVAGAVLGAPISTILMIFELTGDYELTIAVMIATVISSTIAQQVHGFSFFHGQLERRGISVKDGGEASLLREMKVESVMERSYPAIPADASLPEVRQGLRSASASELFVVDGAGRLRGMITFADLYAPAFDGSRDHDSRALDVAHPEPVNLALDEDLGTAVRVFGACGETHLPVVRDRETMTLVGIANQHTVMTAFHRALVQARAEERGEA